MGVGGREAPSGSTSQGSGMKDVVVVVWEWVDVVPPLAPGIGDVVVGVGGQRSDELRVEP